MGGILELFLGLLAGAVSFVAILWLFQRGAASLDSRFHTKAYSRTFLIGMVIVAVAQAMMGGKKS